MIRLVQGLCAIRRRGGRYAAAQFFNDCRISLAERRRIFAKEVQHAQKKVEYISQRLEQEEAQRPPEYCRNPHHRPSQHPYVIRPNRYMPEGYVPEPEMIQTFDPIPHARKADKLQMQLEQQVEVKFTLQTELARIEEFDQLLEHLPEIDLSGPESINLGELFL